MEKDDTRPDYATYQDIEVIYIEIVHNTSVRTSRLDEGLERLNNYGTARIVNRKPVAHSYQDAVAILEQRALNVRQR